MFTPEKLSRLRELQKERKFGEEDFYPGAPTEDIRVECERRVNHFLGRVISLLQRGAPKEALLAQANELEASFLHEDTEEREKVGDYLGDTLRIVGIEQPDPQDGRDPNERDREFGFKPE